MERDLKDYSVNYLGPFEAIQINFRRRKVLEIVEKLNPKNILEVSCGTDSIVNYINYNAFENFYIVEPIVEFLNVAITVKNHKIHTFNDILENVSALKHHTFDFIIVSGLLHEVVNPLSIMHTVHNLCSEKTIVHVNVPNANSIHRLIAKQAGLINSIYDKSETQKRLQQNHTFDFDSLLKLCQEAGFSCIEKGSIFIKPFTHFQMQQLVDLNIIENKVLEGLYNLTSILPEFGSEIYLNLKKG